MNKIFNKKITFILGLLILSLAMPISAQAASKKQSNLNVSTGSASVTIKKSGTNKYSIKLTENTKNVSLRVKVDLWREVTGRLCVRKYCPACSPAMLRQEKHRWDLRIIIHINI